MFAATFFWSRVKCFWEIWNCWNTREPTKLQPLGRPDNTIECSVGLRVSWLLIGVQICQVKDCRSWVVKALKLEHRCCRALFYFSLSLSLSCLKHWRTSSFQTASLYFGGCCFWKAMQLAFDQPVPAASAPSACSSGEAGHESFCSVLYEFWSG